jgi:hypothetical protein
VEKNYKTFLKVSCNHFYCGKLQPEDLLQTSPESGVVSGATAWQVVRKQLIAGDEWQRIKKAPKRSF